MYILLYESLLAWYAGRRMANAQSHLYAVATLAAVAFINVASIVVLCAYMDFRWARELLLLGRAGPFSIAVALGLFAAHLLLFRRRGSAPRPIRPQATPGRWIGMAYAALSLVIFVYISGLASILL